MTLRCIPRRSPTARNPRRSPDRGNARRHEHDITRGEFDLLVTDVFDGDARDDILPLLGVGVPVDVVASTPASASSGPTTVFLGLRLVSSVITSQRTSMSTHPSSAVSESSGSTSRALIR